MEFKDYLNVDESAINTSSQSIKGRDNTVIIDGKEFDELLVQAPINPNPFKVKLSEPIIDFDKDDREKSKVKRDIIKETNNKMNYLFLKLEKEALKLLDDAAKKIDKVK